jgi:histidinol-phosphatase (PHP family)
VTADHHTHTPLCHHAEGTPEAFVEAALAAGLSTYGISDHAPVADEPLDDWRMSQADLPVYLEWIDRARTHAAGRIDIRAGLECDWFPGASDWIDHLADFHDWDYLIGAVHYLEGWDFDHPKWLGRWQEADVEAVWDRYWKAFHEMAASGHFDILAHPDLIKKFGFRPGGDLRRFFEPVVETLAECGGTIELNTAGWHKPCAEAYPAPEFLSLAAAAGVPVVISSDAHRPTELGRDFAAAADLLRSVGYTESQRFVQRQRHPEPL